MPHIDQMFSGQYLKASDLQGKEFTLRIASVVQEEIGQDEKEMKWVVKFEKTDKGLVLNQTNGRTIAAGYGPTTEGWTGKDVVLFPTQVQFGAKMVDAIRVRTDPAQAVQVPMTSVPVQQAAPAPAPAPAPVPERGFPENDDDLPFNLGV